MRRLLTNYIRQFSSKTLTHVNKKGEANMVNVSHKKPTLRTAIASCTVHLSTDVARAIKDNTSKKGDVLTVSKIAGIMGAKQTHNLIPLCHSLLLSNVSIDFDLKGNKLHVTSRVETVGNTGAELEAYLGASIASLTIIDMTKAIDKRTVVNNLRLIHKSGGKSGTYNA